MAKKVPLAKKQGAPVADDSSPTPPRPFNVHTIRFLVGLMGRHDLSEIDLREGDLRIRLRRGPHGVVASMPPAEGPPALSEGARAAPISQATAEPAKPAKALVEIKSPGPGTFYVAANPGAEPFVRVGSRVTPTSVVGVLEAMKLFTEIAADCTGTVVEVLAENQQPVEYNQVLFRVDPAG
jgi:acetyl-CoA carboxylase biotin carboxyl carrier protein